MSIVRSNQRSNEANDDPTVDGVLFLFINLFPFFLLFRTLVGVFSLLTGSCWTPAGVGVGVSCCWLELEPTVAAAVGSVVLAAVAGTVVSSALDATTQQATRMTDNRRSTERETVFFEEGLGWYLYMLVQCLLWLLLVILQIWGYVFVCVCFLFGVLLLFVVLRAWLILLIAFQLGTTSLVASLGFSETLVLSGILTLLI